MFFVDYYYDWGGIFEENFVFFIVGEILMFFVCGLLVEVKIYDFLIGVIWGLLLSMGSVFVIELLDDFWFWICCGDSYFWLWSFDDGVVNVCFYKIYLLLLYFDWVVMVDFGFNDVVVIGSID